MHTDSNLVTVEASPARAASPKHVHAHKHIMISLLCSLTRETEVEGCPVVVEEDTITGSKERPAAKRGGAES